MGVATRFVIAAALATGLLLTFEGSAQSQAEGFALNRFEPSERGSDWFVVESLDLRGHERLAVGLVLDYSRKPLVLYDVSGDEEVALVSDQLFGHLGGAINLWDRLRLSLNVPVAIWQAGDGGQAGATVVQPSGDTAIGDVRFAGDVGIVGEYGDAFTLAVGTRLYAPTGSQDAFTGDGAFRGALRLLTAGRVSWFVYGVGLGSEFRARDESFAGAERGTEVGFNAAAGAILADDKLVVGPEVFAATVVTGSDAFFSRTATPVEAIVGAHYRFHPDWQLGLGGGGGLTRGFGVPQLRGVASLQWLERHETPAPVSPPPDRDSDGIVDQADACPDEPGVETDDPATNGCPPPKDRDEDTILDEFDACPDTPGIANDEPDKHGCPPPADRDEDTVVDPEDACPDEPGMVTQDPATNGCPDPDRDSDSILNEQDGCPDSAGPPNADPKKHGCPAARVVEDLIVIREQLQFAHNRARITRASHAVLDAVRELLVDSPHIQLVSVEGHTDDKGATRYNRSLSERRAASVVKWLVKRGIAKQRLVSIGHGEARPIADNGTPEGRAINRRVQFRIVPQAARPDADTSEAPEATNEPAPGGADDKPE